MSRTDGIFSRLLLMILRDILMVAKPTCIELERKIKDLEKEALEYMRREREFNAERKLLDYSHLKRTLSLMKINEELNREFKNLNRADKEELGHVSDKLGERIKELPASLLNCRLPV